jgi:2-dehydropantoate 2-reductase
MINITIIGVGAMGCLFGARLHPFANVTLLGRWQAQLQAIQADGLWVEDENGRFHHPLAITDDPNAIPPADLALILVKSHQTDRAARQAKAVLKAGGMALTLQNGVGNLGKLTAVLGPHRATIGVTSAGAMVTSAGNIRVAGLGHTYLASTELVEVATEPVEVASTGSATIAPLFVQAGLPTTVTDDVDGLIWGKLAINAGINPVTAVLQVPNGYLAENADARAMMLAAARETQAVAEAMGITLPYPDAGLRALEVARQTAVNRSSMLQDVQRGAPTEIEAICGAVVKNGRLFHVPTPMNDYLLERVQKISNE